MSLKFPAVNRFLRTVSDTRYTRSPVFTGLPAHYRTWRDYSMVEAGGVEPPSEDSLLRATTCVSGLFDLVLGDPGRQGSLRTIPGEVSPHGPPGEGLGTIPLGRRPSAYTGTRRSDVRGYLGRVSVAIVVGDYWFPLFTRSAGPRHATREHRRPRRNRFAPLCSRYHLPTES
jgi:hypothetical protein